MRNHITVTIDELRRFVVPKDVRESFGWITGTRLAITVNLDDGMATVTEVGDKPPALHCEIDDHGRLTIPEPVARSLEWVKGTVIALSPSHNGHALALVRVAL